MFLAKLNTKIKDDDDRHAERVMGDLVLVIDHLGSWDDTLNGTSEHNVFNLSLELLHCARE